MFINEPHGMHQLYSMGSIWMLPLSMLGEMTDEKHMALLNFLCSIVSSVLLNQIDSEPLIGLPMNVEGSLKPLMKEWLAKDHPEAND